MSAIVSSNNTTYSTAAGGVLTELQGLAICGIACILFGPMSILGIIGNLINIVTYISMRPNDGVTVAFLILACSDLSYLVSTASFGLSFAFHFTEKINNMTIWFPIEPYGVSIFFGVFATMFCTFSTLLTTLLAVSRCISVWKPLQFKNIFTPKRSLYLITVFLLFSLGSYIPVLVNMGIIDQFNPRIKAYRPAIWTSPSREQIRVIVWTIRDASLIIATQIIVFVCVIVMADSLKKTSAFRKSQVRATISVTKTKSTKSEKSEAGTKLTGKELHAVQQVFFIALVFMVCNIPRVMFSLTPYFVPDFALDRANHVLYMASVGIQFLFLVINSSSSVLIYYKYSTKFRKHCAALFKLK